MTRARAFLRDVRRVLALWLAATGAGSFVLACRAPSPPPAEKPEWQLLASDLPAALLSVSGRSPDDMVAVGADKGQGPLVVHFDGKGWSTLHTGTTTLPTTPYETFVFGRGISGTGRQHQAAPASAAAASAPTAA